MFTLLDSIQRLGEVFKNDGAPPFNAAVTGLLLLAYLASRWRVRKERKQGSVEEIRFAHRVNLMPLVRPNTESTYPATLQVALVSRLTPLI